MSLTHNIQPQDEEFFAKLKAYLDAAAREAGGKGAVAIPFKRNADGSINREATLEMAVYAEMPR
jgi:hypothetical protein